MLPWSSLTSNSGALGRQGCCQIRVLLQQFAANLDLDNKTVLKSSGVDKKYSLLRWTPYSLSTPSPIPVHRHQNYWPATPPRLSEQTKSQKHFPSPDHRPVTWQSAMGHPDDPFDIDCSIFELLETSMEVLVRHLDLPNDLKDKVCLAVQNATRYVYMKDGDPAALYRDLNIAIAYDCVLNHL